MNSNNPVNLPPLSVSILGVEPLDEFIREIADFVHHMIMSRPNVGPEARVEVEAKVGVLRDKTSNTRLMLPVLVETILAPNDSDLRFETNMSAAQHKHYNTLLNQLQQQSREPGHPSTPLGYKHVKLVDSFYASDNPRDREKIRVTKDEKTGTILEVMTKIRLGDLNIYCPKRTADWRVSVNLEVPVPAFKPAGPPTHTRKKDRICYSHEEFNIDLTQVTTTTSPTSPPEVTHELELEIARPPLLLFTASRRGDMNAPEHERNAFDELIRSFVNNARILVKNASDRSDGWH
ncbi:CYTH-like domain-containing protein [Pisolithus croceorrhizus]|nr:CYTH-like domain-containing protein [Pisolithus croceorrhizus]KAI6129960.1 CYTH-like domain-containing protein [Pisolithus croceorrhizus]KAI6166575.1 CYTH-like domain-containing protein [Pisolithus thermaeus]